LPKRPGWNGVVTDPSGAVIASVKVTATLPTANDPRKLDDFSRKNPTSSFAVQANEAAAKLRGAERQASQALASSPNEPGLVAFENKFPWSESGKVIRERLNGNEKSAYARIQSSRNPQDFAQFRQLFPASSLAAAALQREKELRTAEKEAWKKAYLSTDPRILEDFSQSFSGSTEAIGALSKAQELRRAENEAWQQAVSTASRQSMQEFIQRFAWSDRLAEARRLREEWIQDEKALATAIGSHDPRAIENYIAKSKNPSTIQLARRETSLLRSSEERDWNSRSKSESQKELKEFLEKYPWSPHRKDAQQRLDNMQKPVVLPAPSPTPVIPTEPIPVKSPAVTTSSTPKSGALATNPNTRTPFVWIAPPTEVKLNPFRISQTETTVEDYEAYARSTSAKMPDPPASAAGWKNKKFPMVRVTHAQASGFCKWAGGRLPTDAEWDFAARGGLAGATYANGNKISKAEANYGGNEGVKQVSSYTPNGFGLYDVLGNAAEWTSETTIRGGHFGSSANELKLASRSGGGANSAYHNTGFRCIW